METFLVMCLSFQAGSLKSNCDTVNIISDYTASYRVSCLSQSSCLFPIYMDVSFGAIAAIAYKGNDLVIYKCGQCHKYLEKLLIIMDQIFRWIKLIFASEKSVQGKMTKANILPS